MFLENHSDWVHKVALVCERDTPCELYRPKRAAGFFGLQQAAVFQRFCNEFRAEVAISRLRGAQTLLAEELRERDFISLSMDELEELDQLFLNISFVVVAQLSYGNPN